MDRRSFIKSSLGTGLAFSASGCALLGPKPLLPPLEEEIPDLSESNVLRQVAGIRPYRKNSFRLEIVRGGEKTIIHNYGHGGAGFTMSWGCAEIASGWLMPFTQTGEEIAVLGAGVVGLTTARMLVEQGRRVRIYAAAFSGITSYFAGAQWGPSYVARGESSRDEAFFFEILNRSYRRFERMDGYKYGVSHRLNYADEGGDGPLERLPKGLLPNIRELERLPFPGQPHKGKQFRTLFIEPPIFLAALNQELLEREVAFVRREFNSEAEVRALPQKCIVNCMGLGSRKVYNDDLMTPARGQLIHLRPRQLPYLLVHKDGYIFPRTDAIVVGGTFEKGVEDMTPDPAMGKVILENNRRFFYG
jgi:glycine/D-amino acid oxidase-like deaminating enzyme